MSIKKNIQSKPNRVSLGMKCGECIHFSKGPRKFERLCVQMGIENFADACPEFTPDMTVLASVSVDHMRELARISQQLTQAQMRLFAFTFRNLDYIKKTGYSFGDTVVFSLDGSEYLESYFRGTVIGASKNGMLIYLASSLEELNETNCFLSLYTKSVMPVKKFTKHRRQLIAEGKIRCPNTKSRKTAIEYLNMTEDQLAALQRTLKVAPDTYEPPTLDKAPKAKLDAANKGTVKRKKLPEKYTIDSPAPVDFRINRYGD